MHIPTTARNLFLLFQASMVIAVFWGLLVTAGLLFDIVGLDKVVVEPLVEGCRGLGGVNGRHGGVEDAVGEVVLRAA